jgi:hypothetical protein
MEEGKSMRGRTPDLRQYYRYTEIARKTDENAKGKINIHEAVAYRSGIAVSQPRSTEETKTVVLWAEVDVRSCHLTFEDRGRGLVKLVREAAPLEFED